MSKIIDNVMIADEIMADFEERGMAASFVYYELLEMVESWNNGETKTEDLIEHLEFIMGFEGKEHFERVLAKAQKNIKDIKAMIDGTYHEDETE